MAGPEELERRVSALETQVRELAERVRSSEQDAAAARVLAGGADRDVAEIRGEIRDFRDHNTRVLNALRDDLGDLREQMQTGFTQIRGTLDATAAGQQQIAALLSRLIDREQGPE